MPHDRANDSAGAAASTRDWYERYDKKKGEDRNDLCRNPGVLFQVLAFQVSVVAAVRSLGIRPDRAAILAVGCGGGGDMFQLLPLGFAPENVVGIDILGERIAGARRLFPNVRFEETDASAMEFQAESFDLVFESTMFAAIPDDSLSAAIAVEMLRVCKTGGQVMLVDWRAPKPGDSAYKALTRRSLKELFQVGKKTHA